MEDAQVKTALMEQDAVESEGDSKAFGDGFHPLADLMCQAQLLVDNPPISSNAYAAWRVTAEGVLSKAFGTNSAVAKAVRERGALPTNFFGASMASVVVRLGNERRDRMLRMIAAIENFSGPSPIRAV